VALIEVAPVRGVHLHLLRDPELLIVVAALLDPDRGEERSARERLADRVALGIAQRLLAPRRDPALGCDRPRRARARGDQVVALVPAIPGDLVAAVRLDEREDRVAELGAAVRGVRSR